MNETFETARSRLTGRAYRILGSLPDADDVVQEAWLRWDRADQERIDDPDAWLNTVVTRLAIDRLRQRRRDQERYVGPWLPTPLVDRHSDPAAIAELSDSMTTAFLIMLERLTPDERAAFLLADVFGERYESIAESMGRSVESSRQLASRARRKLRDARADRRDETVVASQLAERFLRALAAGDEADAIECLAPDAVYISDGGAHTRAARRPVREPARIVRLLGNLLRRYPDDWVIAPAMVGGFPGVVIDVGPRLYSATSVEVVGGRIVRISSVLNPDKLIGLERSHSPLE